ncbi:MAG: hypothetical protein KGI68_07845, partial [Alphaproteobacteria bacterium]|nr:hypothetical protein [Alphaproteobacteria bacterium]
MTEAKSFKSGDESHDKRRSSVSGDDNSGLGRFCWRTRERRLAGTKLGEEEWKMTPAARRPHFWRDISILLVAKLVMLT